MPKLPKDLGELIDLAYTMRETREERQREQKAEIEKLKEAETEVEQAILAALKKGKLSGSKGSIAQVTVGISETPKIDNENGGWPALWAWAKKHDAIDIFYKRLVSSAVMERLAAKQKIPAITMFREQTLSLTTIKKSGEAVETAK